MASIQGKLREIDSWVRNRLRYCIWHDWKKPERRRKNLIRLGVDLQHAYTWSRTRMGGWAASQSPILCTTITLARLKKRGYVPMLDYYLKVAPSAFGGNRCIRGPYVQWCERRSPSCSIDGAVYSISVSCFFKSKILFNCCTVIKSNF